MHINRIVKDRLVFETAKKISALLEKEQDNDVLLLLAGGSAMAVYDAISPQFLADNVTVAMTDDRFSREMDINNSHILQATDFYNECINADVFYIPTEVWDEEKPEQLADRFEKGLRGWRQDFPKGRVIAVFGIGEDGHTAGIIPGDGETEFSRLFENADRWVVGYTTKHNQYPERVTINLPFIRTQIDHAVVFVSGENKKTALDKMLADNGKLSETPARVLRELKDVEIFTDIIN